MLIEDEFEMKPVCPQCGKALDLEDECGEQFDPEAVLELCDCGIARNTVIQWEQEQGEISPNYLLVKAAGIPKKPSSGV